MKTNELRIGNFINHEDFNVPMMVSGVLLDDNRIRVAAIGGQSTVMVGGSWSPIAITEEWLLKFGFELKSGGISYDKGKLSIYLGDTILSDDNGRTYFNSWVILEHSPPHVHQLQNLFFALTNEELTIK
jgi:hypothetical protein